MKKYSILTALAALLVAFSATLVWSQNTAQLEGKVTDGTKP